MEKIVEQSWFLEAPFVRMLRHGGLYIDLHGYACDRRA